nr:PREDICTED: neurogenic locus protein delta-like [Bemisia tabaci]
MNGRTILFLLTQVLHCSLGVDHTTHSPQPGSTQGGKPPSTASTQVPLLVSKLTSHATVNVKAATIAATKEATVEATTPTKGTRAPTTAELPLAAPKTGTVLGVSVPPEAPPEPPVSPLDEKIQALNCEMPALPTGSVVWTQNSTRTLVFPLRSGASTNKWRGEVSVQSGDLLRLEIDGTALLKRAGAGVAGGAPSGKKRDYTLQVHQNQVGQDSCDPSQGVKLDVAVERHADKHYVTLLDKDFSDGKNYLTVTSKLWGSECIHLQVTMKSDNCGDDQSCSDKGLCFTKDSMDMYECQCCVGYIGPRCEERDACYPSPCRNNGICVDISQGHDGTTFQCLCPYGFTGKVCEDTSDPCQSGPCQNGGTCSTSNETAAQFKCSCPPGFKGPLCQHGSNHCASSPCVNGICVGQRDGYRCFCQPGYTGFQCQLEINECESSPCLNGGTCTDHIGSFSCACGRGYTGQTCRTKVNLCDPNPCSQHHYCIDKGNSYSCECPKGYIGPLCSIPMTKTVCNTNPCRNGGTCWSSIDSYYCACKPEYTGKTCTDKIASEETEGDKTAKLLHKKEWVYEMPSGVTHVEHLYVAAGTLACALLIVILTVATCHCRMHETYKRIIRATPLFGCRGNRKDADLKAKSGAVKSSDKEPLATRRVMAPVDYTDMYYAMDFSDSQSSPLIQ